MALPSILSRKKSIVPSLLKFSISMVTSVAGTSPKSTLRTLIQSPLCIEVT